MGVVGREYKGKVYVSLLHPGVVSKYAVSENASKVEKMGNKKQNHSCYSLVSFNAHVPQLQTRRNHLNHRQCLWDIFQNVSFCRSSQVVNGGRLKIRSCRGPQVRILPPTFEAKSRGVVDNPFGFWGRRQRFESARDYGYSFQKRKPWAYEVVDYPNGLLSRRPRFKSGYAHTGI